MENLSVRTEKGRPDVASMLEEISISMGPVSVDGRRIIRGAILTFCRSCRALRTFIFSEVCIDEGNGGTARSDAWCTIRYYAY